MSAATSNMQDSDEAHAYAVGEAAGHFLHLKHKLDSSYGSAAGLLTYTRYDKRVLDSIVTRISTSLAIMLTRSQKKEEVEDTQKKVAEAVKDGQIRNASKNYAYFFHRGALANIGGAS